MAHAMTKPNPTSCASMDITVQRTRPARDLWGQWAAYWTGNLAAPAGSTPFPDTTDGDRLALSRAHL